MDFSIVTVFFLALGSLEANPMKSHWIPDVSNEYACQTMNQNNQCAFEDVKFKPITCGNSMTKFMNMLQTTTAARCDIADPCRKKGTSTIGDGESFDFIVIGAGVAGPVIARRLADQEPWWNILLIEAGPEEPSMTAFPGLAFNAVNSSLDWNYETEPTKPHPTACLDTGGVCSWPRGKMVSGTGGMYGMMYARGHPDIYNSWARAGNTGWSYNEIKQYFERAENPEADEMTSQFMPTNSKGPVKIKYFSHKPPFANELLSAARELGYRTSKLYETKQTGFMIAPMMTEDGQRGTTSKYYLRPIMNKPNLKILTNARVTKITMRTWVKAAGGVELIDKYGRKKIIKADKEVILAAGAIGSPQILLSSGIGPADDLKKLGIPVYENLPVGRNLHNHVSVGIQMSINDPNCEDMTMNAYNEYMTKRTGPLSSTGLTQVTAFLESSLAKVGVPDIQVFFDGFSSSCPETNSSPSSGSKKCPMRREIVARPTTVVVKTRGVLTLRSADPLDPPLLYPNYFDADEDLKILVEGVKKVTKLIETKAMKKWDLKLNEKLHPACRRHIFGTDAYWQCLIRARTGPENHQSGTCKMGPSSDPGAVVDPQLRVYRIPNLRVADASVFPIVPNSNPVAAIIMIAEKASDMIINTWKE